MRENCGAGRNLNLDPTRAPMNRTFLVLLLATAILVAGCASIEPAVKPKQTTPVLKLKEESKGQAADTAKTADEPEKTKAVQKPVPAEEGTTGAEPIYEPPTPTDDLTLPDDAMPGDPDSLKKKDLAEAASEAMPPELMDGWKVQVLSLQERKAVNEAYARLKLQLSDLPMHLRYVEGRYILLAGNYGDRSGADSLKAMLVEQGYGDAFVIEAPVVEDSTESKEEMTSGGGMEQEAETSATAEGWRIQIMSLGSRTAAEQEARKAEVKIGRPVYIVESQGMYKLHVGDFTEEDIARVERSRIESKGFQGSFLVTATVNVSR
jgi:hypothetical protein